MSYAVALDFLRGNTVTDNGLKLVSEVLEDDAKKKSYQPPKVHTITLEVFQKNPDPQP